MVSKKMCFVLFFLFLFQLGFVFSADITGDVISKPFSLSISVVSDVASLSISTPQNKTYLVNESLNLTYAVANEDAVWYNVDGSANVTISGSVLFNVSNGPHTLYLYANSSVGNVSVDSVTFYVNSSLLVVSYDEFKGGTRGDSTRFREIAFEDLQNISGVVLENSDFGRIVFNDYINVSEDNDSTDNVFDLDGNVEISDNLIFLDSDALPNFNVSSTLSLYGLNFSDPRILMDGSVCPASICTEISYSGGVFVFNVTHFTSFSAGETPVDVDDSPSGSSGGGGGGSTRNLFEVNVDNLGVSVKVGEVTMEEVVVTNLGINRLDFDVKFQGLEGMTIVSPDEFSLDAGESRIVSLDFVAREDLAPEIYFGKLVFEAGGRTEEISVFMEVESKQELFDIDLELLHDNSEVLIGEDLAVEIELSNMGKTGRIDVEMEYFIRDADGKDVIYHEDTRAVETKLSFIERFDLPAGIEPGQYVFYVKVNYWGKVASASSWFYIIEKPLDDGDNIFEGIIISILTFIIWIIGIVLVLVLRRKKRK